MRAGVLAALAALLLTAVGAGIAHGTEAGLAVLKLLGPVTVLTVGAILVVAARAGSLRRQLAWAGAVAALGIAAAVALFVEDMFLSAHDALYTLLIAGYALVIGGWAAWLAGQRALRRLEATEHARRQLVAAVSHDLRTPITSLRVLAEAIEDDIGDGSTRRDYMRRMTTHVHALSALIEDLFELSRLEAGDIQWSLERVRLDALVTEAVDALRPQADAESVAVRAEVQPGMPAAHANPEQLQRVLFNLIQNAIRHTPADGSVVVRATPAGSLVEIEVADTGPGIPAEERELALEPFFRGNDHDGEGAGLGLAISKAIVEAHGGRLWLAESRQGTCVRFNVPSAS